MQIPQESQHFAHPTAIVVGDFEHCVLYRAQDETIDEIMKLEAPEPLQPFTDASVHSTGMRTANPSADMDEGARRLPYAKRIVHELDSLLKSGDIKYVRLVMPIEMCHRIKEELPQEWQDSITMTIEEDLTFAPLVDVLKRFPS